MKRNYVFGLLLGVLLVTQACKKSSQTEPEVTTDASVYAISQIGGTASAQTTYMLGMKGFPTGTVNTSTALESTSNAVTFRYGKYMYQNNFGAPATLHKFAFDQTTGKATEVGSFAVAGLKTIGSVDFISETVAYATVAGYGSSPKIVQFNPTTMTITSTIDMTATQKVGAGEVYYMALVHTDNYLFVGINYQDANFSNLEEKVFVGVIDRATGKATKVIADSRSSEVWNGGSEASFNLTSMVKDASGDIYVMGYANNGKPSGILRIKNGSTDFDSSYFFDLNAVTGKPCMGILYFGPNAVFTVRNDDASTYPFDSNASGTTATDQYYKIDLANKTTSGNISSAMPKFTGQASWAVAFDNSKVYLNVTSLASNDVYSYQLSDGTVKKEFSTTGKCNGFAKIY